MSHMPTPYSPNFPPNQGYAPPPENDVAGTKKENYPTAPYPNPQANVAGDASNMHMQPGFKPDYHPGQSYPQSGYPPPAQQGYPPVQPPYPSPAQPGYHAPVPQPGYQPAPGYQPGYAPGYPHSGPIMQQPGPAIPGGWMTIPQGLSNCPRGLEYLSMIDQLLVHQKVELLEAFVGFETNNKYTVKNSLGQKVYHAVEDNDCCTRMCCGPVRPFDLKIFDTFRNEVIHLHRPLRCESCCFPCCLQRLEVSSPPGTVIGSVEQEWTLCKPNFVVKNAADEVVLRIKGPVCRFAICGDIKFNVYSKDGERKVGKITKQWSGLAREAFTDSDYFGITFPMDLDVRVKAVLLGACFLIDFMFFEKSGNQESDGPGML